MLSTVLDFRDEQEISKQSQTLLDTYRKWKEDQMKAESKTRDAFQQFETYIQTLYKDKHELLNSYRMLRQDYSVLEAELDRLRKSSFK